MLRFIIVFFVATVDAFAPQLKYRSSSTIFMNKVNDSDTSKVEIGLEKKGNINRQLRRSFLISTAFAGITNLGLAVAAPPGFQRIPTQFIAALGDPNSSSGTNALEWGVWRVDPGPRGVFLRDYERDIVKRNGKAPAGWSFDINDWWVEEHGLIMEAPSFPLEAGKYLVTGGRLVTTVLEVKKDGSWSLENGKLYDVTHLPCRSARYTPNGNGSPFTANQKDFPVQPGAEMPKIEGCNKKDYAVLFVIGKDMS